MDIILKVDHRERAIHEHINAIFAEKPTFCVDIQPPEYTQLDIADYVIVAQTENECKVLAIIERKTLEDYAASLKDGRIMNTEKLLKLREESGCQVYYLIEGNINTGYDTQICGIEYYKILANIRDAQIIHNINILNTSNKLHTARELKFLLERYTKTYDEISHNIKTSGGFDEIVEKCKPTKEQVLRNELVIIWTNLLSNSAKIKTNRSPSLASVVLASKFTLKSWLDGLIKLEDVIDIKVNNRRLNGNIIDLLTEPMTPDLQLKALTTINGISERCAKGILEKTTINDIIKKKSTINIVVFGNNKLGEAKRDKISLIFRARLTMPN